MLSYIVSAVNASVSFGTTLLLNHCIQSPTKVMFSVATVLAREGIKLKVSTWMSKQRKKRRSQFTKSFKLTFSNTFKWAKKWRRTGVCAAATKTSVAVGSDHAVVAIDAALKYKSLTATRLEMARAAFEAAALELKAAERGVEDAEKYYKSLQTFCTKQSGRMIGGDIVFVEQWKVPGDNTIETIPKKESVVIKDVQMNDEAL
jgi:hypothetical protein